MPAPFQISVLCSSERIGKMRRLLISISMIAAMVGTGATAYDPIVLKRGWHRVASDQVDGCRGEVGTNGQVYVLSVTGLDPDQTGRLQIHNGDMVPIDRAILTRADGTWQQYYIPVRPNGGETGMVSALISTPACAVTLEFPWQRHKGWEELPPLARYLAEARR
jgi:hypothetical protein